MKKSMTNISTDEDLKTDGVEGSRGHDVGRAWEVKGFSEGVKGSLDELARAVPRHDVATFHNRISNQIVEIFNFLLEFREHIPTEALGVGEIAE